MPESKGRNKPAYTPPTPGSRELAPNPTWWVPVMVALMVVGLLWTAAYYISGQTYPIPAIGRWNIGIGFGLMLVGFGMTTRWR